MPYAKPNKRQAATSIKASGTATTTEPVKPLPDIHQRITDQIIKAIEAGAGDWKMPWHSKDNGATVLRPINATTGKPYRGVNVLALWTAAGEQGYTSREWATYKQWEERGAQVRRCEKSTYIVFWKIGDKDSPSTEPENGDEAVEGERRPIFARAYPVFNAGQVEGYTPQDGQPASPPLTPPPEAPRIEHAEAFFSALGADIRHGGNRAFYRPTSDHIQMPPFAAFHDPIGYYSTLGHEAAHWTSAKPRLDRDLRGRFGSEAYAAEELIAELSAAFLSADLHLTNEPRPDHAAYVASWLKVLKGDSRAIFTAAARAQQAVDYLHGLQMKALAPQATLPITPPKSIPTQFTLDL